MRVVAYVKLRDLSSCFDLSKCPCFYSLDELDYYIKSFYPNYSIHYNGFDYRCKLLQYLVCVDDSALGFLWFGLEVK